MKMIGAKYLLRILLLLLLVYITNADEESCEVSGMDDEFGPLPLPRSRLHRAPDESRAELDQQINLLRDRAAKEKDNYKVFFTLGMMLQKRDEKYLDGGSDVQECLAAYDRAANIIASSLERAKIVTEIGQLQLSQCLVYNSIGFMKMKADLYQSGLEVYNKVINLDYCPPEDKANAIKHRADILFTLRYYEEAARDYLWVLENDEENYTGEAFMGLSRLTSLDETFIPGGWEWLLEQANKFELIVEARLQSFDGEKVEATVLRHLQAVHYVKYSYYDAKKNYDVAFDALIESHKWKLMNISPRDDAIEDLHYQQMNMLTQHFLRNEYYNFGIGNPTLVPIFIIGFPRSGSTLLERVLDSHPQVGSIGEDSAIGSRLNFVIQALRGNVEQENILKITEDMLSTMFSRYNITHLDFFGETDQPTRLVDKMLGNYNHVGLLHWIFPNALFLHVIREPMDSCFSTFKHDLADIPDSYDLKRLAQSYSHYRRMIEMWDDFLPGVIHHVRYDDMVYNMPNVAKAVIRSAQLKWTDAVIDFHKQKHPINTYSSEQVKEQIYTSSLNYWRKYEKQLQPLKEMLGKYSENNQQTTLLGYIYEDR